MSSLDLSGGAHLSCTAFGSLGIKRGGQLDLVDLLSRYRYSTPQQLVAKSMTGVGMIGRYDAFVGVEDLWRLRAIPIIGEE